MLIGTLAGVFIIPGLYYLFGKLSDGKALIRDQHDEPLSEILESSRQLPVDTESETEHR
jgi:hypothetical protein